MWVMLFLLLISVAFPSVSDQKIAQCDNEFDVEYKPRLSKVFFVRYAGAVVAPPISFFI